jgi:hypothetical protein
MFFATSARTSRSSTPRTVRKVQESRV